MIEISPAVVAAAAVLGASLLTLIGVLAGQYFSERRFKAQQKSADALLPSQIEGAQAGVRKVNADTVDAQNRTIAAQNATIAEMVGQISAQNSVVFGLQATINAQISEIAQLKAQGVSQTGEIARLRGENVKLKQRIIDYPKRVQDLEEIIAQLRQEIRGMQGTASHNASARDLEQKNMAAALASTPKGTITNPAPAPAVEDGDAVPETTTTVQVAIEGELIDKPKK